MARRNQTASEHKFGDIVVQSAAVVGKRIDSITSTIQKLDTEVHETAVQCLIHAAEHRDTTLLKRLLLEALPETSGYRRQGLILWIRDHSPIRLNGKELKITGKDEEGNELPFKIAEANATPFFKYAPAAEVTLRPVYTDSLVVDVLAARRRFKTLLDNTDTSTGKPIDEAKPYFRGNVSAYMDYLNALEKVTAPVDDTKRKDEMAALTIKAPEVAPVTDEPAGAPVVAEEENKAA